MDIEKLIERLEAWNEQHLSVVCGSGHFACDYLCESEDCIVVQAATALSTLQAENAQLRAYLEYEREHADAYYEECGQWETENEKLRAELGRMEEIMRYTGLEPEEIELLAKQRDLYVDACGELSLKRIRELAQADRDGRCVVLPF